MSKLFLTSMSNDDIENVSEFYNEEIINYFDDIIHVLHDSNDRCESYKYLIDKMIDTKKELNSRIILRDYVKRNDVSMNEILYCDEMVPGDYFIYADNLERIQLDFVKKIKSEIIPFMEQAKIGCLYFYSKPFLIRYVESLRFEGSPHWYLTGIQGNVFDYNQVEPDESKVRLNVRPIKRSNRNHFIWHYVKYYTYPFGANSALLGLEKRGDPAKLFPIVERERLEFRNYLRKNGYSLDVEGVKELLDSGLDAEGKIFFNSVKCLNDAYNFYIRKKEDIIDNHDYNSRIVIF